MPITMCLTLGSGSGLDSFGCCLGSRVEIGFGHVGGLLDRFCTDSKALLAAETALLTMATADSEPAGAFFVELSSRELKLLRASVDCTSEPC